VPSRWSCLVLAALIAGLAVGGCASGGGHGTRTHSDTATAASTSVSSTTTTTLPGSNRPQVTLGDKNTVEGFILGELYDLALSAQGYTVGLTRNIGPPPVSLQALEQGSLDVYPEYLNVWDSQVVGVSHPGRSIANAYEVGQTWAAEHQLELLTPTRAADTNGIAVTTRYARENHLRTLADLARVAPTLTLGAPPEFTQSPDGLPAIERAYGFQPARLSPVQIGAQYDQLQAGAIQAAFVQTTDGQLASHAFRLLSDPSRANGFGNIVPVVTASTLANEGPAFVQTINRVDALLSTAVLRRLNAAVDLDHADPGTVARQFLEQHGVLTPSSP
jgi:osmoprotectant transport system substrate-binding protein